jgi:hypothetical protein
MQRGHAARQHQRAAATRHVADQRQPGQGEDHDHGLHNGSPLDTPDRGLKLVRIGPICSDRPLMRQLKVKIEI